MITASLTAKTTRRPSASRRCHRGGLGRRNQNRPGPAMGKTENTPETQRSIRPVVIVRRVRGLLT